MSPRKVIRKEALHVVKQTSSRHSNTTLSRPSILMTLDTPVAPVKFKESVVTAPSLPTPPTPTSTGEIHASVVSPHSADVSVVPKDSFSRTITFASDSDECKDVRDDGDNIQSNEDVNALMSTVANLSTTTDTSEHTLLATSIAALAQTLQRTEHSIHSIWETSLLSMNIFRSEIGGLTETIERFRLAQDKRMKEGVHTVHTQTSLVSPSDDVALDANHITGTVPISGSNSTIRMGAGLDRASPKEGADNNTGITPPYNSHPTTLRLAELDVALKRYLANEAC